MELHSKFGKTKVIGCSNLSGLDIEGRIWAGAVYYIVFGTQTWLHVSDM